MMCRSRIGDTADQKICATSKSRELLFLAKSASGGVGIELGKDSGGDVILAVGKEDHGSFIERFGRRVDDQTVIGGFGPAGDQGADFAENFLAHASLLLFQGRAHLALELRDVLFEF